MNGDDGDGDRDRPPAAPAPGDGGDGYRLATEADRHGWSGGARGNVNDGGGDVNNGGGDGGDDDGQAAMLRQIDRRSEETRRRWPHLPLRGAPR